MASTDRHMAEGGPIKIVMGRGGDPVVNAILEDLDRLEHRWGLVGPASLYWARETLRWVTSPVRRILKPIRALYKRKVPGRGVIVRRSTPRSTPQKK